MTDFQFKERYDIDDFRKIMAVLRSPEGCPWDREQTHESIRRDLIEEAYELAQAIDTGDKENLKEELGDLLMQVIFHARMEEEIGSFDLDDIADAACKKLVFRHPHVFGDVVCENSTQVLDTWDAAKRVEKAQKTVASTMIGVAETLPALMRAEKVQKKASVTGFDSPDGEYALARLKSLADKTELGGDMESQIGELLYAAVNLARKSGVDPEAALHRACQRAIDDFDALEKKLRGMGLKPEDISPEEMGKLYRGRMT